MFADLSAARHDAGDPVPGGGRRHHRAPPGVGPPAAPAAGRRPAAGRHRPGARAARHPAGRRRPGDRHLLAQHPPARLAGRPRVRRRRPTTSSGSPCVSFGFKNGIPVDADMVFDVRFLPNPHWVPELRPQTGLSKPVSDYVLAQDGAERVPGPAAGAAADRGGRLRARGQAVRHHRASAAPAASTAAPRWRRSSPGDCAPRACRPRCCTGIWAGSEPGVRDPATADSRRAPLAPRVRLLPAVVAFGGGHGLSASLTALRRVTDRLTAVVTVADDGGSSGRLRDGAELPAAGRPADGAGGAVRRRRVRPDLGRRAAVPLRRRRARSATTRSATC